MRVLHLHSGNMYGGVETLLVTLAREASGVPGMVPAFALCFEGRLADELGAIGHPPFLLPQVRLSRPHTVLRARRALRDLLRRERFDAVVCHQPWPCVVFGPVVRAAGFPVVLWVHMAVAGRHWLDRLARRVRPDLAICNSQFTRAQVRQWLPDVRTELVYCPVSMPLTVPPGEEAVSRARVREALDTPAGDVVVAIVSRLDTQKGHAVLLDALVRLRDRPGWTCWVVGGAQRPEEVRYEQSLRERARCGGIEPRVRFAGQRSDVAAVLGAADIYCQPNTEPEAFGLSIVEALHAGLPVVTTGAGGALEIVDDTCGRLVPPGDVDLLMATLGGLMADASLRAALGRAARRRPAAFCDPPTQIRQLEDLLTAAGAMTPVAVGARS